MKEQDQFMKASAQRLSLICTVLLLLTLVLAACGNSSNATANPNTPITVHLGYFPNITHAVALVGVQKGTFAQALGKNKLATTTFNAGPDLMQALTAGDIDIGY